MNNIKNRFKSPIFVEPQTSQPDVPLFILSSLLIIISIIFSYSLSVYTVVYYDYSQYHFFIRQLLVGTFSIALMWVMAMVPAHKLIGKVGWTLFFGFLLLMIIMPFLPSFLVTASGGANRWIRLPGFSISPVEFFKIGFIYFLAWSFYRKLIDQPKKMKLKDETLLVLPYFGVFFVAVFFIAYMQKDLGNVVLLFTILMTMFIFANRSLKLFLPIIGLALAGLVGLILVAPHRINRILQWWGSVQDGMLGFMPDFISNAVRVKDFPEPYQVAHSLNAIHNGGFFGTGLGEGNLKMGFLTEVHTDFVLAGITEEWGLVGLVGILILLIGVLWRIFKISNRVENPIYHLFTLGIALMIVVAFLINSYGISGMIPIKGIAVPFLSYGGSSLLSMAISIGLILSISKEIKKEKKDEEFEEPDTLS